MTKFICNSSSYTAAHIAVCTENTIVDTLAMEKKNIGKQLLPNLDTLLKKNNMHLKDLSFISINQGPAPITSLRVALATANGLHRASGIPLVGIDACKAFLAEFPPFAAAPTTIALFNAFNFDIFYGITHLEEPVKTGYQNIDSFLAELAQRIPTGTIRFIGNGVALYLDKIEAIFGSRALIPEPLPTYPSLEQLCATAFANWQAGKTAPELMPLYIKRLAYTPSVR